MTALLENDCSVRVNNWYTHTTSMMSLHYFLRFHKSKVYQLINLKNYPNDFQFLICFFCLEGLRLSDVILLTYIISFD